MMVRVAALCFLAFVLAQAAAEIITPDYIENVIEEVKANDDTIDTSRILSGWEAYPGQHPHQVALRMVAAIGGGVSACGGSVVHREWVLTAAHCTAGRISFVVRAGVTNMTTPPYISEATEFYNYPTFDNSNPGLVQPNDIALIKLKVPIVYTDVLKAIRIQPVGQAYRNYEGDVVVASGFGRTWTDGVSPEVLNWVYLRMVSNTRCAQNFGTALITPNAICASFYNVTSQSVCQGDSGGPLVHIGQDGIPTLIGVTSFVAGGEHGCHSGFPSGFIRPGPFHGWLRYISGVDFENLDESEQTTLPPTTTEAATTEAPTTTEPSTTEPSTTEPPTTTEPSTTEPESESEEDDSDSEEDAEEDPEVKDLLKRLEVLVKVKVRMNKLKKRHETRVVKHHRN